MNKIKVLCILTVLLLSGCGNSSSSQLESSSTSQVVLSEPEQSMSDQSVSNQSVTTDILIISREYRHGWNDNDNGMFITSDGKIYKFDATGKSTDKSRFFTYEQLYDYLVDLMKTTEPIDTVDVKSMVTDIESLKFSKDEWTNEHWGNDIGQHDYELVRKIDGKLVFDTLYTSGDSKSGYTKNKDVMKIVDNCNTIFNKEL